MAMIFLDRIRHRAAAGWCAKSLRKSLFSALSAPWGGRARRGVGAVLCCSVLVACASTGPGGEDNVWAEIRDTGRILITQRGPVPQAPEITPEILAGVEFPLIRMRNLSVGSSATLAGIARRGTASAPVMVWRGAAEATFTTRNGLLIATRGTGDDLISADVRGVEAALRNGGGAYARSYVVLQGNTRGRTLSFDCQLQAAGAETLTLVGQRRDTTRFEESCSGAEGAFRNTYWRGAEGSLWQSRQWTGPEIGHLMIELLKK